MILNVTQAFGANVGKNFEVTIGGQTQNFVIPNDYKVAMQEITLVFKNVPTGTDLLSMNIPEPNIADSVNPKVDKRLLGVGMVTLEIAPLK